MAEPYHEPYDELPPEAKEYHRMLQSVIEEMEAVDWYNQRASVTEDQQLKGVVEHNRDEEIEHACMGLEWLRRNNPTWEENLRTYLFTDKDITAVEEESEDGEAEGNNGEDGSLGLGSLKGGV